MEPTSFELTPEQKGMLASLSRETGKPASTLLAAIAAALEELQEREHVDHVHGETNGSEQTPGVSPSPPKPKHIWELFADAFKDVPEEELARLPVDGAAQHDHYIYGLPKRP
jgi:hypothetical protein